MYLSCVQKALGEFNSPFAVQKRGIATIGLIVGTALAVGAGVTANVAKNKANARQQAENDEARRWQEEMWNKENEYNSPLAQRQRLIEAGYNPNLFGGQNTASSVGSPQALDPTPDKSNPLGDMFNQLSSIINAINLKTLAEAEQTHQETKDMKSKNAFWSHISLMSQDTSKFKSMLEGVLDDQGNLNMSWMPPAHTGLKSRFREYRTGKYFDSIEQFDKYLQKSASPDYYNLWKDFQKKGGELSFLAPETFKGPNYKHFDPRIHFEQSQALKKMLVNNVVLTAEKMSKEDLMNNLRTHDSKYYDITRKMTDEEYDLLKNKVQESAKNITLTGKKISLAGIQEQIANETLQDIRADKKYDLSHLLSQLGDDASILDYLKAFIVSLLYRGASGKFKFGNFSF